MIHISWLTSSVHTKKTEMKYKIFYLSEDESFVLINCIHTHVNKIHVCLHFLLLASMHTHTYTQVHNVTQSTTTQYANQQIGGSSMTSWQLACTAHNKANEYSWHKSQIQKYRHVIPEGHNTQAIHNKEQPQRSSWICDLVQNDTIRH